MDNRRISRMVLALLVGLPFFSCGSAPDTTTPGFNAGYRYMDIPHESDEIPVALWYPTYSTETPYDYNVAATGFTVQGRVAYNAGEVEGLHPVIVFSHGFSGGGIGSVEICEALARAGYYVFVPDHSDPVMSVRIQGASSGTLEDALEYLEDHPFGNGENHLYRVAELQSVLDFVDSSGFNVDKASIILGGHSMGGWTVMKVLEAGFDPKAMFLFSMGELNWLFSGARYFDELFFQTNSEFPTAYYYGGGEYVQAVGAGRGNVYAAYCFTGSPSPCYGFMVTGGNHFSYNSQAVAPGSSGTATQFKSINTRLISFLNYHILGSDTNVVLEGSDVAK